MEIILNDQTYQSQGTADQTVQQLAEEICGTSSGPEAQLVIALICDGQTVDADHLQEVLSYPLARFDRVELRTMRVRDQVIAALSQAMEVLQDSAKIRESAADCLNEGRHEAAMAELRKLLESIRQVQQTTILSCQLMSIEPADVCADGLDFNAILDEVRKSLTELKASMENQDFVLVSDLLRYELTRPLEGWLTILNQLHNLTVTKD